MKAPKNINILPTDSEKVREVKNKLNDLIKRIDECYRLLRADVSDITNNEGVTDHGELTGLSDDDHTQYILASGSRVYTGTGAGFKDEDDMASDSAVATASQQSIKAYIDAFWDYILNSDIGTVFYLWEEDGEKFIERLEPGEYGQVLTTGGPDHRPFWAWVYEEPGADFGGRVLYTVIMEASVEDASIISMDVEKFIEASGLDVTNRDNIDDTDYFTEYSPEMEASVVDASIITMDVETQIEIDMETDYISVSST